MEVGTLAQDADRRHGVGAGGYPQTGFVGRVIAAAVLVLGVAPATAIAAPQDIAATHAYIRADYALARASEAKIGTAQANVEAFNRELGRECPHVGTGSPENEASQPLSYEVAAALWLVSYGTDAGPIRTFVDTVRRLRWGDRKLTRIAQSQATGLHELATLPMPDLCGDVRAWKASGFRTIPAATTGFDRRVEGLEAKSVPPRLLAPYEQPADRTILARTAHLEAKFEEFEVTTGFSDWDRALETLGLNQ
jgi:hypothetical protein